ncbi:MAG: glycosyltransferase family 92 protein [Chlamydiia bacterium]
MSLFGNTSRPLLSLSLSGLLFLHQGAEAKRTDQPHYRLAICTIFKNEAPWLREWIEYHRLVGVDHFVLFNNDSTDQWEEVLEPYMQRGIVEVVHWPNRGTPDGAPYFWVYHTQIPALNEGVRQLRKSADWVALIDVDEFLVPVTAPSMTTLLDELLAKQPRAGCIYLNWVRYGHSNCYDLAPGQLLIEALTHRAPLPSPAAWGQSIVRPQCVHPLTSSRHASSCQLGYHRVLANGQKCMGMLDQDYSAAFINHYEIRTQRYFEEVKRKKKFAMDGFDHEANDWMSFVEYTNSVEEPNGPIQRWAAPLREILNQPVH